MRCCWLLALVLVIGPIGLRDAAADEPTAPRTAGSAKVDGDDGAQATLSALSTAIKMPAKRRQASHKSAPANESTSPSAMESRPTQIVRFAKPSPYAVPDTTTSDATSDEKPLDGQAARQVSHSEEVLTPDVFISDAVPESNRSTVRMASAWTPADLGEPEEEVKVPTVSPKVSSRKIKPERADTGSSVNPLRQTPTSTLVPRGLSNPLRDAGEIR